MILDIVILRAPHVAQFNRSLSTSIECTKYIQNIKDDASRKKAALRKQ